MKCSLTILEGDTQVGKHTDMSNFAKTEVSKVTKVFAI